MNQGSDDSDPDESEATSEPSIQERLRTRTFVVASTQLLADPRWIRVSDIFGDKTDWELLKPIVQSPEDAKYDLYSKRLQRVRGIRNYPYVMHVLERDLSYEEVAEIFVRVNSLGMKLRGSDLALAQITARWKIRSRSSRNSRRNVRNTGSPSILDSSSVRWSYSRRSKVGSAR